MRNGRQKKRFCPQSRTARQPAVELVKGVKGSIVTDYGIPASHIFDEID